MYSLLHKITYVWSNAKMNEHFLQSKVILLKQINVQVVCFTWFVQKIVQKIKF